MSDFHSPVLLDELVSYIDPADNDVILDATLGGGGYAKHILSRYPKILRYIGLDQDQEAINYVNNIIVDSRLNTYHLNFQQFETVLTSTNILPNKYIFDLGVSSYQLGQQERGFSYMNNGPLDMRMDVLNNSLTAADIINTYSKENLADIFYKYGEEPKSRLLANHLVVARSKKKFTETMELASFIHKTIYGAYTRKQQAVKRVFQSIRIAVNKELETIETTLPKVIDLMPSGGICVVVTFHSLEDRIVKNIIKQYLDVSPKVVLKLNKKVVKASKEELQLNSRSKSAKLRAFKKL